MKCQYCHMDVVEFIWHPSKDEVSRRYECIVHGPCDETGRLLKPEDLPIDRDPLGLAENG